MNELIENIPHDKDIEEAILDSLNSCPIFISDYEMAMGLQIAIKNAEGRAKAIGVKDSEDVKIMEDVLAKEQRDKLPKYPLILAFEKADKKQRDLSEKITELLDKLKIKHISYPLELIRKKGLKEAISDIVKMFEEGLGVIEKSFNDINAYKQTDSFLDAIRTSANASAIKTGFDKFDEALGGGLRAGRLYGIGAITSLGKTTFALQIADNMARARQDVLIFSLEMSRYELMGKSVSRGTYAINKDKNEASTLQSILDFSERKNLSPQRMQKLEESIADYRDNVAKHINILEGVGDIGCKQIRELVERFHIFKCSNPVVIIDYLQILAPFNERLNDKQNIDKNVLELKRICRDYQVPVIVINSFNRANYLSEASFEAFKESGAIEYSCDVLIALQLYIEVRDEWTDKQPPLNEKREAVNNAKIKSPRQVEAIILKNRGYKAYDKIFFHYTPEYDYFEETTPSTDLKENEKVKQTNKKTQEEKPFYIDKL